MSLNCIYHAMVSVKNWNFQAAKQTATGFSIKRVRLDRNFIPKDLVRNHSPLADIANLETGSKLLDRPLPFRIGDVFFLRWIAQINRHLTTDHPPGHEFLKLGDFASDRKFQ